MAIYNRSNAAIPSGLHWDDVTQLSVVDTSSAVVRLQNTDGTITEVVGTGISFGGSSNAAAGTVTSVCRLSTDGTTLLEEITGLNHALFDLLVNISAPAAFLLAANDTMTGGALADEIGGFEGNDNLRGLAGNDTLAGGDGNDTLIGGGGADMLDGGADIDAASYAGSTAGVTVNLATNAASGGHAAGDTFTSIENLIGSAHADTLTGDAGNNVLNGVAGNDALDGGDGDDALSGGAGADALHGGGGIDTASYATSTAGVTVNLGTGAASGGDAAGDTFRDIENLIGSSYADTLTGNAGNNVLNGGAGNDALGGGHGNDTLIGGAGSDALHGGGGIDAASYTTSTAGVTVNLTTGAASGGHAAGDTFTSIENLIGSAHADTLTGTAGNNVLNGGAGNDRLAAGDGNDTLIGGTGADALHGGGGIDATSYVTSSAGVTVNLSAGAASGGDAAGDTFTGIENVIGSAHGDILTGNAGKNVLFGGDGDDALAGGAGGDALNGGAGWDAVSYAGSTASVTVNLATRAASGGDAAGDTLTGIEDLIGSAHADILTGNAEDNWLTGGAGGDALDGGAGFDMAGYTTSTAGVTVNLATGVALGGDAAGDTLTAIESLIGSAYADTLTGNAGNNALYGERGNDALIGGAGNDTLFGGDGNDILAPGVGQDWVDGGAGIDAVSYAGSSAGVNLDLATGAASGGHAAGDRLTGIENLIGSAHADTLAGDGGNNVLNGGLGSDVLTGGAGRDAFVFNTALGAANVDQITGFSAADDTIRLENAVFTALTSAGVLSAAAFVTGAAAADATDRIIYNSATGALYYDADGMGGVGQVQFATLVSQPSGVTNADFLVI